MTLESIITPEHLNLMMVVVLPNLVLWVIVAIGIVYRLYRPARPLEDPEAIISPEVPGPQPTLSHLSAGSSPMFTPFGTAVPGRPYVITVSETPRLCRGVPVSRPSRLSTTLEELEDDNIEELQDCRKVEDVLTLDMGFLDDSVLESPVAVVAKEKRYMIQFVPPSSVQPQLELWRWVTQEVKQYHDSLQY